MKRITNTNIEGLEALILQEAKRIAESTPTVALLNADTPAISTVAELLGFDFSGVIKVSDVEGVQARVIALREGGSAVVKRMLSSFSKALTDATRLAERNKTRTIAEDDLSLLSGKHVIGRPSALWPLKEIIEAHQTFTQFLNDQSSAASPTYGERESGEFITRFTNLPPSLYVDTNCRFSLTEDGEITYRYIHQLHARDGIYASLRGMARTMGETLTTRRNKALLGGVRHMEKFALWSIEQLEEEIEMRTGELANREIDLVIEVAEYDFTPAADPIPLTKAVA